jgi:GMP synthase (glutamine-hydrolysing)
LIFKKYNYFIFGGSSEFGLADETSYPVERKIILKKTKRLINYLIEKNFPTLGICFGHQLIAIHLGAKVVRNLNKKEVGTYIVSIKDGYEKDKIFNNIKKNFYAQFAHIDFIYEDSKNKKIISIAKTQNDNFSMFKFKTNVYGVQFHPELSKKTFIERLLISSENEYKKKKFKLKESPIASLIIKNFLSIKT